MFKQKRFKRIQWNFPFGDSGDKKTKDEFKKTIPRFFKSCFKLQLPEDRVHVTLKQEQLGDYWKTRQIENPIVRGSADAGYRLIRKRSFGTCRKERYPGYRHVYGQLDELYRTTPKNRQKKILLEFRLGGTLLEFICLPV
ncbi:unnamed protein product [Rotaria sp. Silwood2]|nr:unnamed protein product [Rotaria sp. Silwood2]